MESLKVLCISSPGLPTPAKGYAGLENICGWTAIELARRGHEVSLACSIDSPHKMLKEKGVKTIPTVFSSLAGIPEVEAWMVLKARLKDRYDFVMDDSHLSVSMAMDKEKYGVALRRIHDAQSWAQPPPLEYPCFVTPSRGVAENIAARHSWFYYRVANHGIPIEDYPVGPGGNRMLFLGRVQSIKGVDVAVQVSEATGLGLDIVGPVNHLQGDSFLRSLQKSVDGERIKLHGEVSQERKVEFLRNAYCLLMPSRFAEPWGLTSTEAQACGTPVIVSANGGLPETIRHGITGFVAWDFTEFVEYVELAGKLSRSDCRKWAEKFSVETMVDRLLVLREQAIAHPW